MEKVKVKLGEICIKTLSDGTLGRFESRNELTLYVSLQDSIGTFYSSVGNIETMNTSLDKFSIELEYVS